MSDPVLLRIEGCDIALRVMSFAGAERLHEADAAGSVAALRLEVRPERGAEVAPLDVDALIGAPAEITLVTEATSRTVHGIVDWVEEAFEGVAIGVVDKTAQMSDGCDHRVFLGKSSEEIATELFTEHGITVASRLAEPPPVRDQCVQAFESPLSFVSRILGEDGVGWHTESGADGASVILTDGTAHPGVEDGESFEWQPDGSGALTSGEATVYGTVVERKQTFDRLTLRDFDFEKPGLDLTMTEGDGALERYEYPAGFTDPAAGSTLAKRRLEEARSGALTLRGKTGSRRLAPGRVLEISNAPDASTNRRWLIVSLEHGAAAADGQSRQGSGVTAEERRYEATFRAVSADQAHRPSRGDVSGNRASFGGVQNAVMTGPAGQEIHTDEHGRVKARLRWDRNASDDDTSSHWVRPMQPPTSGGFFLPRVGWEVLLGFMGPSGDTPIEMGRLDNGGHPPGESLPGQKTMSRFGSGTTPGGETANVMRFGDAAGSEDLFVNASKGFNERTENDKGTTVKGDETHDVGGDRTEIFGIVKSVKVDGNQQYSVSGTRDVAVTGSFSIEASDETVAVGGARIFKVGGDYETQAASIVRSVGGAKAEIAIQEINRHVTGASTVLVGGGWTDIGGLASSVSVLGAHKLSAGAMMVNAKNYSLKASLLKETYATKVVKSGSSQNENFGGSASASKITLNGAGAKVTITSSEIKIDASTDTSGAGITTDKEENG